MLKNYIKIAWRNFTRQKLYSLINITGLATGLAVCMLIMLYVAHEMSYDRFHKNADRIFVPSMHMKIGSESINILNFSYASGELIKQSQPVVEDYMRMMGYFKPVTVYNPAVADQKFNESKLLFADPGFFKFFSFKLISGQASTVLKQPFSVVLSSDMAKKYFGDENPVGRTIAIKTDSVYTYHITGVAENSPSNSSVAFNFVASTASLLSMEEASNYVGPPQIWGGSFETYLLLKHASDTAALSRNLQRNTEKLLNAKDNHFIFYPFPDLHLHDFTGSSTIKYLKIFPLVAVLILLLALVNYMSLSTAGATLRAKEVGVRKVSGASRKSIAAQFYVESALLACLSFVLGYGLCYLCKSWFLNVLDLKIDNAFLYSPLVLGLMLALLVITILIAGSYPALVLSSFKPAITLKGKLSKQTGGVVVRKVFTTLQFAISVGLIICGIIIDRQLYYFRHADTGINKENVVMIPVGSSFGTHYPAFKKDVQLLPGISNVTTSQHAMFQGYDMYQMNGKSKGESVMLPALAIDDNYIETLGLKWKIPPASSAQFTGKDKVVINELAIDALKLPRNPVGTSLQSGLRRIEVIGVLKNFKFTSMEYASSALGLFLMPDTAKYWSRAGCTLFARIEPHTNLPTLLGNIAAIYRKYDQDTPFSYTFMDDAFNAQYKAEERLASIFSIFTVITILLATLGLFGLAAFTIEQRTKEIGIRKVLGASLSSVAALLSADFLKLVLLSIVIASPVAWWAMHNWLQNFAYRITIQWWVFALAGFTAILTAIVTISYHALKASVVNPVKSLRSE